MKSEKTARLMVIFKNYKFQSMFFNYFRNILLVALIIFLLFATVTLSIYTLSARENFSLLFETSLAKTVELFETTTTAINKNAYILPKNKKVLNYLLKPPQEETAFDRQYRMELQDIIFYMVVEMPGVNSIYIYSNKNEYMASLSEFRLAKDYFDNDWLNHINHDEASYAFPRKKASSSEFYDTVTFVKKLYMDKKCIGNAIYNVDYTYFKNLVDYSLEDIQESFYVISRNGLVIYSTDETLVNTVLTPETDTKLHKLFAQALENGGGSSYSNKMINAAAVSEDEEFIFISKANNYLVMGTQKSYLTIIVLGGVIGILASLVLSFVFSVKMYDHIIRLVSMFNASYEKGIPEMSGEMEYISSNIMRVIDRNKVIENELAEKLTELRKAQSIALLHQINPHFILNTLQLISFDMIDEAKSDTPASRAVILLSDILRSNLNSEEFLIPVEEEIEQAKKYLEIENIRNNGKFNVEWNIDPLLMQCSIIKFSLQPILENSIMHGLMSKKINDRLIRIYIFKEAQYIYIEIADNGIGMSDEKLADLQKRLLASHIQENAHIGLCNVDKRIKLVFGENCGISVKSKVNEGTSVIIKQKIVTENMLVKKHSAKEKEL